MTYTLVLTILPSHANTNTIFIRLFIDIYVFIIIIEFKVIVAFIVSLCCFNIAVKVYWNLLYGRTLANTEYSGISRQEIQSLFSFTDREKAKPQPAVDVAKLFSQDMPGTAPPADKCPHVVQSRLSRPWKATMRHTFIFSFPSVQQVTVIYSWRKSWYWFLQKKIWSRLILGIC